MFYLLVRPKLKKILGTFQTQHLKRQKKLGDKEKKVQKNQKRKRKSIYGIGGLKNGLDTFRR